MMKYGQNAKVAGKIVFSREGAARVYKTLCRMFNDHPSMETAAIIGSVESDLMKLGFTPEEIEKLETETY